MRVAFFSDNFHPELGGIQDSIEVLARQLAAQGHQIDFYVPRYSARDYAQAGLAPREIELGSAVTVHRLPSVSYPSPTNQSRLAIPSPAPFRGKRRPDVIHAHTIFGMGLNGLAAAKALKIPIVGTNHTAIKAFSPHITVSMDSAVAYTRWFFNRCDLASAPSRSVFDEIGAPRPPLSVIPNAIDVEMFKPAEPGRKSALKARLGLSDATIVYAGRLGVEKNIDDIVRAIATARETFPSIGLAIAGHGTDGDRLRKMAAGLGLDANVRFFGTLGKASLAELFQASDLFVTMSRSETQCLALTQAMACGLPVIGANSRALPEFISERTGVLVEEGNHVMLAAHMVRLLRDGPLGRRLADGAWRAAQSFSPARITAMWEACYDALSPRRARSAACSGCRT